MSELSSEMRLYALFVTANASLGIEPMTHCTHVVNSFLTTKPLLLPSQFIYNIQT